MAHWKQRTVGKRVSCTGVGLHSGKPATVTLAPAPADSGITFVRMDTGVEIPARSAHVVETTLCTTLGLGAHRVATVEHVMAALFGLGVDNCRVEVDGPEVPILDGSAAPFVALVREAGIVAQKPGKKFLVVERPIEVSEGGKVARLTPAPQLSVHYTIDFKHPLVTDQSYAFTFSDRAFDRELARARTFCFRKDVERMQAMGLALGGSLENAIVIDDFSILNEDGLRFPDEFVRHKILDAVGDLAMAGMPIIGALRAVKSGHALNHALVEKLLADPSAYRVVQVTGDAGLEPFALRLPGFGLPEVA